MKELEMKENILTVAQKGEAILGLVAVDVAEHEFGQSYLVEFVRAMHATMLERMGVGIAAPQVYLSKRIIIVASKPNPRYPDAPLMEPITMINPIILEQSESTLSGEEGCLSVPQERGIVLRSESIKVSYRTLHGEQVEQVFKGFPARIVQHEIDHLNGILFVERVN